MKKILVIGATSTIAMAFAKTHTQDADFFLIARDAEKLKQTVDHFAVLCRGRVSTSILDANDFSNHETVLNDAFATLGEVDIVLIAHGTLPDQQACERDVDLAIREFSSNGLSVISLLTLIANRMQEQGDGIIAVISSVAGDRGRPSNHLYGAAKASVTTFCEGLRVRLFKSGVHLLTVKPGFVDTPMTKGLELPKLLVVKPEVIARAINVGIARKKNTLYAPWFWYWIMVVIRSVPEYIFKRVNL